ncbi:MAG: hypothetical protein BZY87_07505 [SAR202 cluster bacterium Io17-Chloro-G6]|nr:MAG: hypothetical protein BZY87_07505 [SAR202 cluster bacterium Io17-Chloro-G6]
MESVGSQTGRRWVIASLVCAAVALGFAPVVIGTLGVVAGGVGVLKGARWWGTAGVSASFVGGVVGYSLAAGLVT